MFVEHLVKSLRRTLFGRGLYKVPTAFIRLIKAADSDWKDQHFCNKKPKKQQICKKCERKRADETRCDAATIWERRT